MRFSKWSRMVLVAGLALCLPAPGQAQLGGLKKRLKEKIEGPATEKASPGGDAKEAPVTAELIEQLIAGLKAENAERDRLIASRSTNPDVVKFLTQDRQKARCDSLKAASEAQQKVDKRKLQDLTIAMTADPSKAQTNMKQINEITARLMRAAADADNCRDDMKPSSSDKQFVDALKAAQAGQDAIGAKAAGLSVADYALLRERVMMVLYANELGRRVPGFTPEARDSIRTHKDTLLALVSRDFEHDGMRKQP